MRYVMELFKYLLVLALEILLSCTIKIFLVRNNS